MRKLVLVSSLLLIQSAGAFAPTNLPNCVIWLQAGSDDVQFNPNTGRVTTWLDRSGNNNHAYQTDTNRQPVFVSSGLNGLPALHFDQRLFNDAYAAGLVTSNALNAAFSVFTVMCVRDDSGRGIAWRRFVGSLDKNWLLGTYSDGSFYAHADTSELSGIAARLRAPYQFGRTYTLSAVNTTSEQRFYVNGYDLTGNSSLTTSPGRLTIGGCARNAADPSDAVIAEVIVYERALSAAERDQVEAYLKERYAVSDAGFDGSVWSGFGSSNLWSDNANWHQPLPARPMLAFETNIQSTSVNDLPGLTVDSIMVWNRNISASGNPITLENNFFCFPQSTVNWALDTILPDGQHTFSVRGNRRLNFSGRLSGTGGICLGTGALYDGTLALLCPTNSFTGPVHIQTGIAEISRLAPAGTSSSLGAATGADATMHLGNVRYNIVGGVRYTGTASATTDRDFRFMRNVAILNGSPTDAALAFSGTMCPVDEPRAGLATLELGGTSRGTNLIASTLSDSPLGQNHLAVTVKGGVWRFNQSNTFTGGFTLEGGTVFLTGTGGLGQGPVRVRTGATLGGNGVATSASAILQYEGAIISPGDPDENGGIGCLTYDIGAGLSGVRLVIQTTLQTNDSIRVNATLPLPAFLTVEVQAASAADCPESLRIIDATALIGAQDLSAWEIIAPCAYRAVREGSSVLLVKEPAFSADAWQYNMKIRFPGYTGTSVLTNFPVLIKLTEGTGNRFHYGECDPNGADLLFTDADGTRLQHEIERWEINGESCVWVKLPRLTRGTEITAHWGNPAFAPLKATFQPIDLPGCALWLDAAASFTADGASIATWPDLSGNDRHATQSNAAAQPRWVANAVNGLPAARFEVTGTMDGMVTGWNTQEDSAYTVIVAGTHRREVDPGDSWRRIVKGSAAYNACIAVRSDNTFEAGTRDGDYKSLATSSTRATLGAPFVGTIVADGTHSYFALNGFAFPTVAVAGAFGDLGLGASGFGNDGWDGDILEVIAYDRALSLAERQRVERYLAEKYDGLSAHFVPEFGLQQWLRADMVNADVLDNGVPRVSRADNQTSVFGMHATQGTTNRMPEKVASAINGKPALRFDAVPDQYDALRSPVAPIGEAYTAFAVFAPNTTGLTERVIMQGYGGVSRLGITNGILMRSAGGTVSQLLPCPPHQPLIATLRCNGLSSSFYVNGVNLTQNATPSGNWAGSGGVENRVIIFGAGYGDGALLRPMDGDLAEVMVYNRILSDHERQRVEAYLADRYAIPINRNNAQVWSEGYTGVWHLTDTSRLLLADASPAQNGAVLLGIDEAYAVPAWTAEGLAWDAASQFGRSRTAPVTPSTLSFWALQTESSANLATVIAGTSGAPYVALNNAAGKLRVAATDAAPLIGGSDAWTHYTVVVNPASQAVQVYGNGLPLDTAPGVQGSGMPTGQALTFGHDANTSDVSKTFSGALDELRLSTTARNADWIRAAYLTQAENASFTSYHHFGTFFMLR